MYLKIGSFILAIFFIVNLSSCVAGPPLHRFGTPQMEAGGDKIYLRGGEVITGSKAIPNQKRKPYNIVTKVEMNGISYKDVIAFQVDGEYYRIKGKFFLLRVVDGKLSIYTGPVEIPEYRRKSVDNSQIEFKYFYQLNGSGALG